MNCEKQYAVATVLRPFRYTVLSLPENTDVDCPVCNLQLAPFEFQGWKSGGGVIETTTID